MPAEMEAVMARSSDAAMARAKSASPAAAAVTMKASGGRSCSSVRCERINTAGGTTLGAAQRQKHEEQHGEEARACRGQQRQRMRLDGERDGQRLAIGGGEERRGQRAKTEADDDADPGEHERLDQIDGKHEPARGAERLEGGDDAALLRHVAADGVADADAAKQQRGQSRPG